MGDCEFCGSYIDHLPYQCNTCSGIFCGDCRLPEHHRCSFETAYALTDDESPEPMDTQPQRRSSDSPREPITQSGEWKARARIEDPSPATNPDGSLDRMREPDRPPNASLDGSPKGHSPIRWGIIIALFGVVLIVGLSMSGVDLGNGGASDVPEWADDANSIQSDDTDDVNEGDGSNDAGSPGSNVDFHQLNNSEVEILVEKYVNEVRMEHGIGALEPYPEVRDVARNHSEHMLTRDYFSHNTPAGETPQDRVDRAGVNCRVGENLAQTWYRMNVITEEGTERYTNEDELAQGLVQQWMNSPGHRENILNADYSLHGVGVVEEDRYVLATHKFCL